MSGSCSGPGFSSAGLWINAQLVSYIDYKSALAIQQVLLSLFTLKATRYQKKHPQFLPCANLMLECRVLTGKGREEEEGGQGVDICRRGDGDIRCPGRGRSF